MTAVIQDTLDLPIVAPAYVPGMTLAQKYTAWRAVNGHVFREFERRALALHAAGRKHFGVKMIAEAVRYETSVRAIGDPWDINNSYVSFIARELIARNPELGACIEIRALASERSS